MLSNLRDRIRNSSRDDFEIYSINIIKYIFLSIGIFGIVFMFITMIDWEINANGNFEILLNTVESTDGDYAAAIYFIVFGFNTFSLFNYLQSTVIARNSNRSLFLNSQQENSRIRNEMNDIVNRANMETQVYNNVQDFNPDQLMNYNARDRINIAYLKLRWMDKIEAESTRRFGTKYRQKFILQIHLDEKELGFTKLMRNPISFDMGAFDTDFEDIVWSTIQIQKPKPLLKQLKNPRNRRPFLLRKLGKTSKEKREKGIKYAKDIRA